MSQPFGDDTIVALYKREDKNHEEKPSGTVRMQFKAGEPIIPMGSEVDKLYVLRVGTVKLVPGSSQRDSLLVKTFHGNPHKDMPIIGARYYFTRRLSTIAYVAQSNVAVYAIDSSVLVDIHNNNDVLAVMRELIVNSDIAEQFAPIAAKQLDMPVGKLTDEASLLAICQELRSPAFRSRLDPILRTFFQKFMKKRREAAEQAGVEASVCVDPPAIFK